MDFTALHRRALRRLKLPAVLAAATLRIGDRQFRTPMLGRTMCEPAEPWMLELLHRLLPLRGGTFLDVGVNLGQTMLAVMAVDGQRPYLGIEPNPHCVAYAERLMALNAFTTCRIVPVALGRSPGVQLLQLYYASATDASASLVEGFRPEQRISRLVPVAVFPYRAIEEAMSAGPLSFVKIDVEGGEADVLLTLRDAVSASQPWIIAEILPCYSAEAVDRLSRQQQIEQMMKDLDYVILRIRKGDGDRLAGLDLIEDIGIHGDLSACDYVFCPSGDAARVLGMPVQAQG
ncbi:FkbM family methyltransferase [Rhodoligotrophos appendicifer]|uniref:FkbM family methyltransferase n=1 Tax=Rhodoligotrophos appendicifer TaxID=987056 RepID=UPI001478177A|nr:FkbM family methyltransferase [Rhodoligotrophos appendicifer]